MKFDWMRLLPPYWIQIHKTNWEWDEILNQLLDQHEVMRVDKYTAKVGGIEVWVSSWPHGYGTSWYPRVELLPSVKTRLRLRSLTTRWDDTPMKPIRDRLGKRQ